MGLFDFILKAPIIVQFIDKTDINCNILLSWVNILLKDYTNEVTCVIFYAFSKKAIWTKNDDIDLSSFINNEKIDWVKSISIIFNNQEDIAWTFLVSKTPVAHIYGDCFSEISVYKNKIEYLGSNEDKEISYLITNKLRQSKINALLLRDPNEISNEWCYGSISDIYLYYKIENYCWRYSIPSVSFFLDLRYILNDTSSQPISLTKGEMHNLVKLCDDKIMDLWGEKGLKNKLGKAITVKKWLSLA